MAFELNDWSQIASSSPWSERKLMRFVAVDGYIYMTGGVIDGIGTKTSEVWKTADCIAWELLTDSPGWEARGAHGFIHFNDKFYVFGGANTAGTFLNDVWESSDNCETWQQVTGSADWGVRHEFGYCIHNDEFYLSGGFNGSTFLKDVWKTSDFSVWTQTTSDVGYGHREHSMISFNGDLYIYMGEGPPYNQRIWKSVDDGVNWSMVGDAAYGRRREHSTTLSVAKDKVAVIGGFDYITDESFNDVWESSDGLTFTSVTQINEYTARSDFGFVINGNYVYIIGGTNDSGSVLFNDVWMTTLDDIYPDDEPVPNEGPDIEQDLCCSFSLALNESQGVIGSFSENTGSDAAFCDPGFTGLQVEDTYGIIRYLLIDDTDGKMYDIALKDGPSESGIVKYWKDKVNVSGNGGTDIEPYCFFGADSGTYEHYLIKHAISHIFARAADKSYRGATGYDSSGFYTGIEFLLRLFVDSEQVTPERKTKNIPITGDIHVDDEVEGHAIQLELSANMGCHMIIGRKTDYIVSDTPIGDLVMTEDDYQEELCQPTMWYSSYPLYTDRADGLELSSTIQDLITAISGVTGGTDDAWSFTEAITLPSITLSSGTIMLWHQGIDTLEIGSSEITLTDYDTIGSWTLSYATGITASGAVTITPTGTGKVFDLRAFNSEISSDAIEYYFDNINDHDGDTVLP